MSNLQKHPSVEELTAFNVGLLPPENASIVERHISDCEPCCETLLNLASNDTFVGLLQLANDPDDALTMNHPSSADSITPSSVESMQDLFADHPRYEVISRIARGGMGVVFKANHRNMKRTVALKVINQSLIRDSQVVERFHREVQTAARLSHPNIVTAYDADQANDNHFLVMEYVDGESLAALVQRDSPIPIRDACQHISQVANGLQYAHRQGVVHRDIKPHNLMLSDGTVKILDFGLASLAELTPAKNEHGAMPENSSLTAACSIMGTPDFMSPEQATNTNPVDFRSDIYSLGATLYYLLAGQPPFASGSVAQKLTCLADSEPTPIQSLRPDVPQELADVIGRMMAKDPDNRFQSAQEVELALLPLVDDSPTRPTARTQSSSGRRSWWPFNTTKTIVSAAAALLLILSGVIFVVTDNGTLVIESVDDSVKVIVSQGRDDTGGTFIQTSVTDTITGSEVKRLRSGEYKLSLASDDNQFELDQGGFVLRRGGKVIVTVSRKPIVEPNANAAGLLTQNLLPATTKAWISIPDAKDLSKRFDRSQLGMLAKNKNLEPFADSIKQQLESLIDQQNVGLSLDVDQLGGVSSGEICFAGVLQDGGQHGVVFLMDVSNTREKAVEFGDQITQKLIQRGATKKENTIQGATYTQLTLDKPKVFRTPRNTFQTIVDVKGDNKSSWMLVSNNESVFRDVLRRLTNPERIQAVETLAAQQSFQTVMKQTESEFDSQIKWFVDPFGCLELAQKIRDDAATSEPPRTGAAETLAKAGFDALRGMGGQVALMTGTHEVLHKTFVYATKLKAGQEQLFELLDFNTNRQLPHTMPRWVPAEASSVIIGDWNMQKALKATGHFWDAHTEPGSCKQLLLDLEQDPHLRFDLEGVVEQMGNRFVIVVENEKPIGPKSERVVISVLLKGDTKFVFENISRANFDAHIIKVGRYEFIEIDSTRKKIEIDDFNHPPLDHLSFPSQEDEDNQRFEFFEKRYLVISGNELLVANDKNYLEKILARKDSMLESESDFIRIKKTLAKLTDDTKVAWRQFGRLDKGLETNYEMLRRGEMASSQTMLARVVNQVFNKQAAENARLQGKKFDKAAVRKQELDGAKLPADFSKSIAPYLGPTGSVVEALDNGWRITGVIMNRNNSPSENSDNAKAEPKTLKKMAFPAMAQGELIRSGNKLSENEIKELQAKADSDPNDVESRLQLLGYYSRNSILTKDLRKPHQQLAIWFIRNYPDSAAAGDHAAHVMGSMNPLGYIRAREIWLEQISEHDQNVTVLMNAAGFFLLDDREKAEELFKKAQALEPDNTRITSQLAHLYQLSGNHGSSKSKRREQNEKAMAQYERALKPTADGPGKSRLVINIAKTAFKLDQLDKAKTFADRLLNEHSSDGDAVHTGNTLLGLLALNASDIEVANKYLIESGKTKGSPVLGSFGPSMQLANALLEKGQQDTVLEYFELCEKFWTYSAGKKKLAAWKAAVKAGNTPDFGPNLAR